MLKFKNNKSNLYIGTCKEICELYNFFLNSETAVERYPEELPWIAEKNYGLQLKFFDEELNQPTICRMEYRDAKSFVTDLLWLTEYELVDSDYNLTF